MDPFLYLILTPLSLILVITAVGFAYFCGAMILEDIENRKPNERRSDV